MLPPFFALNVEARLAAKSVSIMEEPELELTVEDNRDVVGFTAAPPGENMPVFGRGMELGPPPRPRPC